ncbi:aminotransferase yhxA [Bacillus salitolerans]|uniref:Aminotransferase yhxA n=1 Tax=Bacillus salitolerans TaxID=1437434 RepID=A0ABW4LSJ1_9BACI
METKTKKLLSGITAAIVIGGLTGCQNAPEPPSDPDCDDWEWEEDDGVYECEQYSSSYYGHYYYGGRYYRNKTDLFKSSAYQKYKSSSSFKGSKGFGSGSSVSGG